MQVREADGARDALQAGEVDGEMNMKDLEATMQDLEVDREVNMPDS